MPQQSRTLHLVKYIFFAPLGTAGELPTRMLLASCPLHKARAAKSVPAAEDHAGCADLARLIVRRQIHVLAHGAGHAFEIGVFGAAAGHDEDSNPSVRKGP